MKPAFFILYLSVQLLSCKDVPNQSLQHVGGRNDSIAHRIESMLQWYMKEDQNYPLTTAWQNDQPYLNGKEAYASWLQQSGYFHKQFFAHFDERVRRCEEEGAKEDGLDHLECEEFDFVIHTGAQHFDRVKDIKTKRVNDYMQTELILHAFSDKGSIRLDEETKLLFELLQDDQKNWVISKVGYHKPDWGAIWIE
jgi:hypothetical protein